MTWKDRLSNSGKAAKWREKQNRRCEIDERRFAPVMHEVCCFCFETDMSTRDNITCKEDTQSAT